MVLPARANRARLRALLPLFLDKPDFGADPQAIEGPIEDGVAVKIDLSPVWRFDKTAILLGQEFGHPAVAFRDMLLHLALHVVLGILDLAHRRVKSFPDRNQRVFALRRVAARPIDDYILVFRQGDVQRDAEQITAAMPRLRPCDDDLATRDAAAELF